MYQEELLSKKVEGFTKAHISAKYLVMNLSKSSQNVLNDFKSNVGILLSSLRSKSEVEFVSKKLIEYLGSIKYVDMSLGMTNSMVSKSILGSISTSKSDEDLFYYNKQLFVDHLVSVMEEGSINISEEHFTKEEFEEFKSKLSDIAESIFVFQQRQEAANEVLYNSVEELRDQLIKDAEKGKIFGKEFVQQQLAGKIIDMTVKGGAITAINHFAPEATRLLTDIL